MTVTPAMDLAAAFYFDAMLQNKLIVDHHVSQFVRDIEIEAPASASRVTLDAYQAFRNICIGNISELSKNEVRTLNRLVSMDGVWIEECSMATQLKFRKYKAMMEAAEKPLVDNFEMHLPDHAFFEFATPVAPVQE